MERFARCDFHAPLSSEGLAFISSTYMPFRLTWDDMAVFQDAWILFITKCKPEEVLEMREKIRKLREVL
jgi:hypothetical protein